MPKNPTIKKVLLIGSGPIVIGQAAEFDYAGTQACQSLREEGLEVVLVNSNPATIMTDQAMADHIYIEPLTIPTLERIIAKERPDSILSTLGGQTGLTLSMQLYKEGILDRYGVRLLGANVETIDKAEDRELFKEAMEAIGQPCIPSKVVSTVEDALDFAQELGYPLIVRPAFTLGGSGGGIANNDEELAKIAKNGLYLSPITQILVERCISGWKEIEFEVIRDSHGNGIVVCSMENLDPVGIHTGDSIVVAPAMTLADKEYQMLRTAALDIVSEMRIEGGCNVQFALHPESFDYAVIEVNPRVSRSSALASKATGYPIAKVAAKIALGYRLDEIRNAITKKTYACFEPSIDYVVVKFPKWPFDKFIYSQRRLGTQMKATGEVMSIGQSFESALMKAVRGAEIKQNDLNLPAMAALTEGELKEKIRAQDDQRLFAIYEALKRGISKQEIHEMTRIDLWFLSKLESILRMERSLQAEDLTPESYLEAKKMGFPDDLIGAYSKQSIDAERHASYKMVDTCAGEFEALTPYFYASFDEEDEASAYLARSDRKHSKGNILVLGSGPIRIGQGIEFDYASVHCVWALKTLGYDVAIMNNNPETVSTDFDTADRLYFEPLTPEDVMHVIHVEQPLAVVVAFGGQTAINLTKFLESRGVPILGTSGECIDRAEDRERFEQILHDLNIAMPTGETVMTKKDALRVANELNYPVLIRPSYVLGGQNMVIAYDDSDTIEYMDLILEQKIENPVLLDKYLSGIEVEVDAICDGEDILIPGIMEHVERAGIHSGDSIAVYPAWNLTGEIIESLIDYTKRLANAMGTIGLMNIQYVVHENRIYVIEVNPRSSRTVPYISKVTGIPMVDLATRVMFGEKLRNMEYGTGLFRTVPYVAVKVPIFSFEKLLDLDTQLGPEMKSTGEVLGIGKNIEEALYKGMKAAGYPMKKSGGIYVTVRDSDKVELPYVIKKLVRLGFKLYASAGTASILTKSGFDVTVVKKISESEDNALKLLESGEIQYMISTSSKGRIPNKDSVKLRRKAIELSIPCLTSIDTANALADCLVGRYSEANMELVDINKMRKEKQKHSFIKMQSCGNDYIFFDCMEQEVANARSLSVLLSDTHFGIGSDGLVLILPSETADARMRSFNKDGSEGQTAGNNIRCVAKYLYESGRVPKLDMQIETASGIRHLKLFERSGQIDDVTVNMGLPSFEPEHIPTTLPKDKLMQHPYVVDGVRYRLNVLSMGNPHCIVFNEEVAQIDVQTVGAELEHALFFPQRTNVEFVTVLSPHDLLLRTWERGSGETLACGTGVCAAVVAAVENGYCKRNEDVRVKVLGGELIANYRDDGVYLSGKVEEVYRGEIKL